MFKYCIKTFGIVLPKNENEANVTLGRYKTQFLTDFHRVWIFSKPPIACIFRLFFSRAQTGITWMIHPSTPWPSTTTGEGDRPVLLSLSENHNTSSFPSFSFDCTLPIARLAEGVN